MGDVMSITNVAWEKEKAVSVVPVFSLFFRGYTQTEVGFKFDYNHVSV